MYKYMIRFITSHKILLVWSILLGVLTIGANIGLLATSGYLISSAALHPVSILMLWIPIVGVRFFGISRAVFRYGERYFSHDLTFRILSDIRTWFYDRLEPLAPARIMTYRSGDLLNSAVADVDTLQDFYLRALAPPIVAVIVIIAVFWLLSLWSISLGLIEVGILLLAGVGVPILTYYLGESKGTKIVSLRASFTANFIDQVQGMSDILAFSKERSSIQKLSTQQHSLVRQQLAMAGIGGFTNGVMTFFNHFSMWLLLLLAIPLIQSGKIPGVDLAVIAQTALASFEAITPLPVAFQYLGRSFASMKHVRDLLDAKPVIKESNQSVEIDLHPILSIQHVSFRYQTDEPLVLHDVSVEIESGKHVAIVGPSGAGKSSIVQLLSRFFDFEEGSVIIGNHEIKEIPLEQVHSIIAIAPQKPHVFNTSVQENLQIAKTDATPMEMKKALQIAQAEEFVMHLPEKYNTFVGEHGFKLSGGERQRLAIARAILTDASIYVFDEPTSGLDAMTESRLLDSVHQNLHDKTVLWITHRLAGLESMDQIIVMNHGKIVEKGTHAQLLKLQGVYSQMWNIQNQMLLQGDFAV